MVKIKGNKGNMVEDVNVIYQQREKTQRKNNKRSSQITKMSKSKKRPNEQVTFICAHKQKDQRQISFRSTMNEEQGQLLDIKEWIRGKSKDN
jgi:hypothetical protein